MVEEIQKVNKVESAKIRKKCPGVPVYRTQKGKSNRGICWIPETVMFTNDLATDIANLEELMNAYDCIKGDERVKNIYGRLRWNLTQKNKLLKGLQLNKNTNYKGNN